MQLHLCEHGDLRFGALLLFCSALVPSLASAQYAERPSLVGSGAPDVDASGRSIKDRRVRAVHSADPSLQGGTAWLFERDPYLAFQLGRDINFREFTERHGVFDTKVSNLLGPMPDGTTRKITANNQVSCLGCHNLPAGNPGGGTNFSKDSGLGRNAPHYYGGGVMEMLAVQVRADLLALADADGNGWISSSEAQSAPAQARVQTSTNANGGPVDYGSFRLTNGATGKPQLNNIIRVWYLDAQGRVVNGATQVDGITTHGYNFEVVLWGWGQGVGRSALNPTNRAFLWDPFKTHSGLESCDASTTQDPDGDGVSVPTLAGCIQFPATHKPGDRGLNMDPLGFSRDDPDADGVCNEISEGDLDLGEWYMLNAPRPAFAGPPRMWNEGLNVMGEMGCLSCHIPNWTIKARDARQAGDRRFFDLDVTFDAQGNRLVGRVVPLHDRVGDRYVRRFGAFEVQGVFSDLAHHNMGEGFKETDFSGNTNMVWRTPPLWGVGNGYPWGHDGMSQTLEDVILRHGGEAATSRAAFAGANRKRRDTVLTMLERMVLDDIETLPTDVNGDGQIAQNFMVAGMNTLQERYNAEWLFRNPLRIQGPVVNSAGQTIVSFAGTNIDEAYGRNLPLRLDSDGDCWPNVWDAAPFQPGIKDGVVN